MGRTTRILTGDCLEQMKQLADNSVDSIATDPPYGLRFMNKHWDYDVPQVPVFVEMLRVLKPGGHLLCFGGSRTSHRVAVNIEDAGFDIRDTLMWLYGSGWPKSHNLHGDHEGWGTALKPAHEPIILARKPLEGTVAENVAKWGTGAINIDDSRIPYTGKTDPRTFGGKWKTDKAASNVYTGEYAGTDQTVSAKGRWPANVLHDGSEEATCNFPDSVGQKGDLAQQDKDRQPPNGCYGVMGPATAREKRGDSGSAARFFYCPKVSKADRNEGVEHLNIEKTVEHSRTDRCSSCHGRILQNPDRPSACKCENPVREHATYTGNYHPTVKPTALMQYLVRLVTPAAGVVLDPFMGSGSTGKACMLEGFSFVGIEREPDYVKIAEARIKKAQEG